MSVHQFNVEDAKKHGVNGAIMMANMRFWIAKNKANKRHFYDGRYWTYNSSKAFAELFPYWSAKQIERILAKLKAEGVLLTGHFSQNAYDRTNWYSLSEASSPETKESISQKSYPPFPEIGKSTNTDIKTDINHTPAQAPGEVVGFDQFWQAWPKNERKQDKAKCQSKWKKDKLGESLEIILQDIESKKRTKKWEDGYIESPLVYLNGKRWLDAEQEPEAPDAWRSDPLFRGGI